MDEDISRSQTNSNSLVQQPMRAKAYCAHLNIRDHWALRRMSKSPDQVVSLKQNPQCLMPQESLVLIYRPTEGKEVWIDFAQPEDRTLGLWCGVSD
ncbi:hypothetical protein TNCV_1913241 [Trichonephila clavipes]|nr:hypothetical protein TNCV_1913241 [Trichonephila clavipes]